MSTIQESETLLRRFHDCGVEFVIIGGICNVLHGVTLVTQDVDVCCRFTPANLLKLELAVRDLHPVHRQTPQRLPFRLDDRLCRELRNLYLRTDLGVMAGGVRLKQNPSLDIKIAKCQRDCHETHA